MTMTEKAYFSTTRFVPLELMTQGVAEWIAHNAHDSVDGPAGDDYREDAAALLRSIGYQDLLDAIDRLSIELDYDPDDPNWGTKDRSRGQLRRVIRKQHKIAKSAHATIKLFEARWLASDERVNNAVRIVDQFNHADLMSDDDWAELRMALRPETREVEGDDGLP